MMGHGPLVTCTQEVGMHRYGEHTDLTVSAIWDVLGSLLTLTLTLPLTLNPKPYLTLTLTVNLTLTIFNFNFNRVTSELDVPRNKFRLFPVLSLHTLEQRYAIMVIESTYMKVLLLFYLCG
jgi:hypothetical protein